MNLVVLQINKDSKNLDLFIKKNGVHELLDLKSESDHGAPSSLTDNLINLVLASVEND